MGSYNRCKLGYGAPIDGRTLMGKWGYFTILIGLITPFTYTYSFLYNSTSRGHNPSYLFIRPFIGLITPIYNWYGPHLAGFLSWKSPKLGPFSVPLVVLVEHFWDYIWLTILVCKLLDLLSFYWFGCLGIWIWIWFCWVWIFWIFGLGITSQHDVGPNKPVSRVKYITAVLGEKNCEIHLFSSIYNWNHNDRSGPSCER